MLFAADEIPDDLREFFEPANCGRCYVCRLVSVFREVRRVLRDDGTLWLNLGDSYASTGPGSWGSSDKSTLTTRSRNGAWAPGNTVGKTPPRGDHGLKPKDLVGIPWRVAFALQADGWYLRSDIIWAKPNPMPESVTDRPTKAHEYLFLLSKQPRYYYDADAIREEQTPATLARYAYGFNKVGKGIQENGASHTKGQGADGGMIETNPAGRNARSVWQIATQPTPEAHFATFPEELARRCILAGTSERGGCAACGAPWQRVTERDRRPRSTSIGGAYYEASSALAGSRATNFHTGADTTVTTLGWEPSCACFAFNGYDANGVFVHAYQDEHGNICGEPPPPRRQTVLDPFAGSGTTALVARHHGRHAVGIDLSAEYLQIAAARLQQLSLLV